MGPVILGEEAHSCTSAAGNIIVAIMHQVDALLDYNSRVLYQLILNIISIFFRALGFMLKSELINVDTFIKAK